MAHAATFAELFKELVEVLADLKWDIALPPKEADGGISGMVIGDAEYIDQILRQLEDGCDYEIFQKGPRC